MSVIFIYLSKIRKESFPLATATYQEKVEWSFSQNQSGETIIVYKDIPLESETNRFNYLFRQLWRTFTFLIMITLLLPILEYIFSNIICASD